MTAELPQVDGTFSAWVEATARRVIREEVDKLLSGLDMTCPDCGAALTFPPDEPSDVSLPT